MIVLDTHVFIWWVNEDDNLTSACREAIASNIPEGIGVSIMTYWEIAKLYEKSRLELECGIDEWISRSLDYPGVTLINLTTDIILESTRLPGSFHRDPADQLLVATARILNAPLLTMDAKILAYPHVRLQRIG